MGSIIKAVKIPYIPVIVFFTFYLYSATSIPATAFKCTKDGITIFSDKPCEGTVSEEIYIQDHYTEGETLRPEELEMLKEIEEKERKQLEEANTEVPQTETVSETQPEKPQFKQEDCDKATADLKQWQKVMSLGYPPEEDEIYQREYKTKYEIQKKSCGIE